MRILICWKYTLNNSVWLKRHLREEWLLFNSLYCHANATHIFPDTQVNMRLQKVRIRRNDECVFVRCLLRIYTIQFLHAGRISLTPPRARHRTLRKLLWRKLVTLMSACSGRNYNFLCINGFFGVFLRESARTAAKSRTNLSTHSGKSTKRLGRLAPNLANMCIFIWEWVYILRQTNCPSRHKRGTWGGGGLRGQQFKHLGKLTDRWRCVGGGSFLEGSANPLIKLTDWDGKRNHWLTEIENVITDDQNW